jgi:hypothetical protein
MPPTRHKDINILLPKPVNILLYLADVIRYLEMGGTPWIIQVDPL